MSKYTASVTISAELDNLSSFSELIAAAAGIGNVAYASLHNNVIEAREATAAGLIVPAPAPAETGKGKGKKSADKAPALAQAPSDSSPKSGAEKAAEAATTSTATAEPSPTATPPAAPAPAAGPSRDDKLVGLRALASAKIAANAANRAKVHAIIRGNCPAGDEPAMSKIADDKLGSAKAELEAL